MTDVPHLGLLRCVLRSFETAFSTIPGVQILEVYGRDVVIVRGIARSPTLHPIEMEWEVRMGDLVRRKSGANEAFRQQIMEMVETALEGGLNGDGAATELEGLGLLGPDPDHHDIQARRLGDARGMQLEDLAYLPGRNAIMTHDIRLDTFAFSHVAIDRYTVELMERQMLAETKKLAAMPAIKRSLVSLLGLVHDQVVREGHAVHHGRSDAVPYEVMATNRPLQKERRLLPRLPLPAKGASFFSRDEAFFDGDTVTLIGFESRMPATVQAAAIGRRLGDIVETGTVLDNRRILDVDDYRDNGPSGVRHVDITIEMDPISLDTI